LNTKARKTPIRFLSGDATWLGLPATLIHPVASDSSSEQLRLVAVLWLEVRQIMSSLGQFDAACYSGTNEVLRRPWALGLVPRCV